MKRSYTFFLALWATTALWAFDFMGDNFLCYNITSNSVPYTVAVTCQVSFSSENYYGISSFTIPTTVEHNGITYAVTSIDYRAFLNCFALKSITIPEGVTEIGHAAFYGCTYLTEITLPSSVQEVADNGFALCGKLQKNACKSVGSSDYSLQNFL